MKRYRDSCAFSFDIVDKQTEDAYTMMGQQESKAGCIREMFLDFVSVNGIINEYNEIPKRERLKKFFGVTDSEKAANAPQAGQKAAEHKCRCQFDLYNTDRLTNNALVMLYLSNNKSLLIRELFLDFVNANGIISNYKDIPKAERLERFFGDMRPCHTDPSMVTYTTPDGTTLRISIEQPLQ